MGFSLVRSVALAAAVAISATAVHAQSGAGAYLAGRQAAYSSDFETAARYYTRALARDPSNPELMEAATLSYLSLGQIERALPIARQIEAKELRSQVAHMVVVAAMISKQDYAAVLDRRENKQIIGPLVDGLLEGWAQIGDGSVAEGLAQFDTVSEQAGLRGFGLYHKAMALAMVGDFEGAEAIFAEDGAGGVVLTRRGAMARAEILSQLERNTDALEMLDTAFGGGIDPGLQKMITALEAGETLPFSHARSVSDGMAEVFYSVAAALSNEANNDYTLLYSRVAEYLRADHIDAVLLSAELLEKLGQFNLAISAYRKVPSEHTAYHAAELGRAEALRRNAKPDAAIEVLLQLSRSHPDLAIVHSTLGDLLRQQEDYAASVEAYDKALALTEATARSRWFVLYARGISNERLDNWDAAEADFREALELNPNQPQVLNYLGYSMVEKQLHLDEALGMIERAVAARPESGYIVDSLGWVLYRLGRYAEAVSHMEKAVELMPIDPIVNDHLGDVYWAVGRAREAEFQWHRALSFDPEEKDADRIRRKLEVGLDQVLADEGAEPLKVADEEG